MKMKMMKVVIALMATICVVACSSNASKGNVGGGTDAVADSTEEMRLNPDSTSVAQVPYDLDFSLKNLLVYLNHYEDYELADKNGLSLIYEDSYQNEEVESIETLYGRDVEKGDKDVLGYQLKATTAHAIYFKMDLDTSTRAEIGFINHDDAKGFIDVVLKSEPVEMDGKTYYVHPKQQDEGQYLYIETPYGEDDFETRFVIYPMEKKDGFYRMEIEVYV